jgi:hypothetical protein
MFGHVRGGKKNNLASLFAPPLHIMFDGSFEEAVQKGKLTEKWLLVNIQVSSSGCV